MRSAYPSRCPRACCARSRSVSGGSFEASCKSAPRRQVVEQSSLDPRHSLLTADDRKEEAQWGIQREVARVFSGLRGDGEKKQYMVRACDAIAPLASAPPSSSSAIESARRIYALRGGGKQEGQPRRRDSRARPLREPAAPARRSRHSKGGKTGVGDAHAVLPPLARRVGALARVLDNDVQVARVARVGRHAHRALDRLALLQRHHVAEVEDGLCGRGEPRVSPADGKKGGTGEVQQRRTLPVGVLGMGAGREADGLVACAECAVEPAEERVDV